jgi:hypothetical protein
VWCTQPASAGEAEQLAEEGALSAVYRDVSYRRLSSCRDQVYFAQ